MLLATSAPLLAASVNSSGVNCSGMPCTASCWRKPASAPTIAPTMRQCSRSCRAAVGASGVSATKRELRRRLRTYGVPDIAVVVGDVNDNGRRRGQGRDWIDRKQVHTAGWMHCCKVVGREGAAERRRTLAMRDYREECDRRRGKARTTSRTLRAEVLGFGFWV